MAFGAKTRPRHPGPFVSRSGLRKYSVRRHGWFTRGARLLNWLPGPSGRKTPEIPRFFPDSVPSELIDSDLPMNHRKARKNKKINTIRQ